MKYAYNKKTKNIKDIEIIRKIFIKDCFIQFLFFSIFNMYILHIEKHNIKKKDQK